MIEWVSMVSFVDPEKTGNIRDMEGPWQKEPDKAQWIADGLDCLAVRNHFGSWCGYVGVPEGHPFHGVLYDDVTPYPDVHGGLTFSRECAPDEPETGICHVPQPGRPDNVWWLGFDCGHFDDRQPGMEKTLDMLEARFPDLPRRSELPPLPDWATPTYKPFSFIVAETTRLAAQLAKPAPAV